MLIQVVKLQVMEDFRTGSVHESRLWKLGHVGPVCVGMGHVEGLGHVGLRISKLAEVEVVQRSG